MKQLLFTVTLLCLFSGCAPYSKDIRVKTVVGYSADLSHYRSYSWLDNITSLNDPDGKWQTPELDITGEIKYFIDQELQNHGLHINTTDPQISVTFQLGANMQSLQLTTAPDSKLAVLKNVPDATLMIVLTDTATNDIIWASSAEAELQLNGNAELIRKRIDYTITEMFKKLNKKSLF